MLPVRYIFYGAARGMIAAMVTKIGQRRKAHLYISEWMAYRGLSDQRLADRLEVERETVWRWQNQQHRLNPDKIAAIAAALDLEPEELYRPPGTVSLDAIVKGAPDDIQSMAADIVRRLVSQGSK